MVYSDLKAAVLGYVHRTDPITAAMLPTWLALAEQRIYLGEANTDPLRIGAMVKTVAAQTDGNLPTDFLEAVRVRGAITSSGCTATLDYLPLDHLPDSRSGFGYTGNVLVLSPNTGFPVELVYYARLTTPAADTDTNWLLANAPGLYLSAMLVEAAAFARDDALMAREAQNFTSRMAALQDADDRSRHSGSPLAPATSHREVV